MAIDWQFGLLVGLLALAFSVYSWRAQRQTILRLETQLGAASGAAARDAGGPPTGEMRRQIADLRSTVTVLQADHVSDQRRINELERQLRGAQERIRELERELMRFGRADDSAKRDAAQEVLLAVIGPDQNLELDLAAIRSWRTKYRLLELTKERATKLQLKAALDRHRLRKHPVRLLHLGVHADDSGIMLADGAADRLWVAENFPGVEVAVLLGCESAGICDVLACVPHVVYTNAKIAQSDAWQFAQAFWEELSNRGRVQAAFDAALKRVPPTLAAQIDLRSTD